MYVYLDTQIKQLIQEAKEMGRTMKIRHAKILFCGASGVGKTSFVRLLKNERFISEPDSTGVGHIQQIMVFKKASFQGTKWVDLDLTQEIKQLKLRLHHKIMSDFKEHGQSTEQIDFTVKSDVADHNASDHEAAKVECSPSRSLTMNTKRHVDWSNDVEKHLHALSPTFEDFEKPPPIWDILTLLDTGGQPQFINMLPAVNTSATVTFVVMNMLNCVTGLNSKVIVRHYNKGNKSYEPYNLNYTNKDLMKCLVALLKDSILEDTSLPAVHISKHASCSKPGLCFVGTHLDKIKLEDVDKINEEVEKLIGQLGPNDNISIWNHDGILFPVDNTAAGKEDASQKSIASDIRCKVKKTIDKKAVYEVPIAWIIPELEIRKMCTKERCYVTLPDVLKMYDSIMPHLSKEDVEKQTKAALQFFHKFGVLLYFHDVFGMNNYVISSIQWLFSNLSNLVHCSFNGKIVDHEDLKALKSKGVLSRSLMQEINIDSLEGIEIDYFFELLKKLKIATPYPKHDSSDYLMLTVLDSYNQECNDLFNSNSIEGTALAVQYESGTFPRGIFSCLIVQLIQENYGKWELLDTFSGKRCIFTNMAVFRTTSGYYIIFNDKVSYLEIHIRRSQSCDNISIHYEVQQSITYALLEVFSAPCLKYGFFCKSKFCLKPIMFLNVEQMNGNKSVPTRMYCNEHEYTDLGLHKLWMVIITSLVKKLF